MAAAAAAVQWRQHSNGGSGCSSVWRWRQLGSSAAAVATAAAEALWWWRWQPQRGSGSGNGSTAARRRQLDGGRGSLVVALALVAQPNGQQRPVVVPAAAATDRPAAMLDNLRVMKTTRKTNVGPWQQGNNKGGHVDGSDDGLLSFLSNREDNNAATGDNQGDVTAADISRGDADAGMSSILLAASNTPNHNNNANDDYANAEDIAGKKTLMRDATADGNGSGT
jgi:hypothetical protein